MAALATGLVAVRYAIIPGLALVGRGPAVRAAFAYAVFGLVLVASAALLIHAAVRPRSLVAAIGAALTVGLLGMWGLTATPGSWPRLLLHLATILCTVALATQIVQGIVHGRRCLLWLLPVMLLGFPIGFLAGGLIGLQIVTQYCQLPLLGAGIASVLCSG
jgi:hypothetical protein